MKLNRSQCLQEHSCLVLALKKISLFAVKFEGKFRPNEKPSTKHHTKERWLCVSATIFSVPSYTHLHVLASLYCLCEVMRKKQHKPIVNRPFSQHHKDKQSEANTKNKRKTQKLYSRKKSVPKSQMSSDSADGGLDDESSFVQYMQNLIRYLPDPRDMRKVSDHSTITSLGSMSLKTSFRTHNIGFDHQTSSVLLEDTPEADELLRNTALNSLGVCASTHVATPSYAPPTRLYSRTRTHTHTHAYVRIRTHIRVPTLARTCTRKCPP